MIDKFHPSDKVLVLDFDHTLYDTDAFLMFELRSNMLKKFKISPEDWERAYEETVPKGYTVEKHLTEIGKLTGGKVYENIEIKKFEESINFDKYLYPDSKNFINEAKNKGYKILLLSFGAVSWQTKKVESVGLHKLVDIARYTRESGGKMGIIKQYTEDCPRVVYVDNSSRELDNVRRFLPYVKTYLMNRVPTKARSKEQDEYMRIRYMESRKMAEKRPHYEHKECHTLSEVQL